MKPFRLLAAAGVVALVLLAIPGAGPALAAGPDVTINTPGADETKTGPVSITGSISQGGSNPVVTKASVTLSSDDDWTSENSTQSYTNGASNSPIFSGGGARVSFDWTVTPKYNGRYTITLSGTGQSDGGLGGPTTATSQVTRSFSVEIAPVKPTGVAAVMDDATQHVTVSWKANPEPDIAYYQVLRSYQGGNPAAVGSPVAPSSQPKFTDDLSQKAQGQYKYAVQAIRRARTCKTVSSDDACQRGVAGPVSAYSPSVTVRATPATTTTSTTIKKSGGGTTGGTTVGGTSGGTTGGGTSGGTSGGGTTGGTSGKTAPRNTGGYAPGGNVDLSLFGSLLGGNGKTSTGGGKVDEGTYDPTLGYDRSQKPVDSGGDNSLITIGGTSLPKPSDDWVRFAGMGSLATALLVHVLWFKQQVDRLPLEAISE